MAPPLPDVRPLVLAARDQWVKRLIDPSRANALLFFRDLKVGMLELPVASAAVTGLVEGGSVDLRDLRAALPELKPEVIARSLQAVRAKALSNREEKGVETLQLALGMATWPALDGGKPYNAPVLLLPLEIQARGQGGLDVAIAVRGEPRVNPVLLHVLAEDYAVQVDAEALLKACSAEDDEGRWTAQPDALHARLAASIPRTLEGFRIVPRAVVANFHFARMSMVEDLGKNLDQLAQSDLVAALAGHVPTRAMLGQVDVGASARLDERAPGDDYFVLLSDSSQQTAIESAEGGQSLVVQGPPGTGKSQTIANLIAQCVARGKRVLFVAEKRAALDAVIKRLSHPEVGLGHLVLDLHGAAVSRKDVMARLKSALDTVAQSLPPAGVEATHREFEERRRELNEHARRVNAPRAPLGLSTVAIVGRLMRLPPEARTKLRLDGRAFCRLDADALRSLRETVRDMAARPTLHLGTDRSPWIHATLGDAAAAAGALAAARRASHALVPEQRAALARAAREAGIEPPRSLALGSELAAVLIEAERVRGQLDWAVFTADPAALARALAPARKGWVGRAWAAISDAAYRAARQRAQALSAAPVPTTTVLLERVEAAAELLARWRELAPSAPFPAHAESAASLEAASAALAGAIRELRAAVPGLPADDADFGDLATTLDALASDGDTVFQIPAVREHQRRIAACGFAAVVDEIRAQGLDPRSYEGRFEHVLLTSAMEAAFAAEPKLAAFRGASHAQTVARFRVLDAERLKLAALRVRRLHAEAVIEAMNQHQAEAQLVRKEASKKARHLPLRRLLEQAPHVLTRLAPCWVASPLSVSQLLASSNDHFDLVVFDEGSQIPPEDAVPALYRARQVVAAGDQHQMPPTHFFATAVESDDIESSTDVARGAEEAIAGFESLLASLESFLPNRMLEWHYRSEDERLIAFSNNEVYSKRLVTFPSARGHAAISHVLVEHDAALGGQEESASREVERVVQMVLEHARTRPHESLGVITMGIKHANRVQAAVDKAVVEAQRSDPELAAYFDMGREERFFVKNLETVQGDERDAIVLSIGYGKDVSGGLPLRFGPLLHESGYRRLNVAVTRAKRRMCVVSSFLPHEIDLSRSSARGLAMLKAYLQYAQGGGESYVPTERADELELNAFEADVRGALESRGVKVRAQYGASRFRIDMVAMHPVRTGQPVLAIECDGAAYHSSATARDRDRLRQQHLERLGWTFHRVWSTDWFRDREAEMTALLVAVEQAVASSDAALAGECERARPTPVPALAVDALHRAGAAVPPAPARGARPHLPRHDTIDAFSESQLNALLAWIASDGLLRTDEEMIREAQQELGFARLGSRIRGRLESAIARRRR